MHAFVHHLEFNNFFWHSPITLRIRIQFSVIFFPSTQNDQRTNNRRKKKIDHGRWDPKLWRKCLLRTCSDSVVVIVALSCRSVGLRVPATTTLMMGSKIMVIFILKESGENETPKKERNKRKKCQCKKGIEVCGCGIFILSLHEHCGKWKQCSQLSLPQWNGPSALGTRNTFRTHF